MMTVKDWLSQSPDRKIKQVNQAPYACKNFASLLKATPVLASSDFAGIFNALYQQLLLMRGCP